MFLFPLLSDKFIKYTYILCAVIIALILLWDIGILLLWLHQGKVMLGTTISGWSGRIMRPSVLHEIVMNIVVLGIIVFQRKLIHNRLDSFFGEDNPFRRNFALYFVVAMTAFFVWYFIKVVYLQNYHPMTW